MKVFQSGPLFMLVDGQTGRLVSELGGPLPPAPLGGLVRHVHVVDPWVRVRDVATLPAIVRTAMAEGVDDPEPRRR